MKSVALRFFAFMLILALASALSAQTFPSPDYFQRFFHFPHVQTQLPGPQSLDEYIVNGKLRLGLQDAIRLMLLNNTEVRVGQAQLDQTPFGIDRAYSPFDPLFTAGFTPQRSTQPTTSALQGARTLSQLQQQTVFAYNHLLQTGTSYAISFTTSRATSNSTFSLFNPSFTSGATFTV